MEHSVLEKESSPARIQELAGKYLTFSLAQESYGIGILKIREIIGMMAITPIPKTPSYVKGVINLRGKVIPVVDLRLKFGLEETDYTERTCIIVVEIHAEDAVLPMGIIVDAVSEVLNINTEDIEPAPDFGSAIETTYIHGLAKKERNVIILVNIDRVLATEEIKSLNDNV